MPLEPVSGSAGGEDTPRDVHGGDDVHERARLRSLGAYSESDALRTVDAGDASQEAILDLIVAATLAQDDPLDDEPADADLRDPGNLRDLRKDRHLRNDEASLSGAAADEGMSPGWGFAAEGIVDGQVPGPVLAGLTDRAHGSGLHLVDDDELTGVIRAWRRLTSWATARELAAIAELARRRPAEGPGAGPEQAMDLGRRTGPEDGAGDRQTTSPGRSAPTGPGAAPARGDGRTTGSGATAGASSSFAARINVTVPLSVMLGLSDAPAEVAGFGPVDGQLAPS
jgi:hypothetical protein